jgi:hypothetical protein
MIEVKRSNFNHIKSFFDFGEKAIMCVNIHISTILLIFGEEGCNEILKRVFTEAVNWPEFHSEMASWPSHCFTPCMIIKSVVEKMIHDHEIVLTD